MFSGHWDEKGRSEVVVDFPESLVEGMLEFIYTANFTKTITHEEAVEWLNLSNFYKLDGLKGIMEKKLIEALTINNVISTYLVADQFNALKLKRECAVLIKQ